MDTTTLGRPDPDPTTRPPLPFWDRIKFLLLFTAIFGVLVWNTYLDIEVVGGSFVDAAREQLRHATPLLFLAWVEVIRQLHYLLSEHWAGWHQLWSRHIFGRVNRRIGRLNDWNRYRLGRVMKFVAALVVLAYVLGQVYHQPPTTALFRLPATIWSALPMLLQAVFIMVIAVMQFVAIFWFLSRGGVETYMPNDIKTRFSDVWGQDAVLARVRENLVFLDDPESIEDRGGYVPSGLLLWGPPGTGKTLLAEAVAGETGKPFVFVEPSAFIQMFMGIGPMKVKALFRKLRKLSMRYGGVVAFFDEADSLGNRGAAPQGGWQGAWSPSAATCNGLAYVSEPSAGAVMREQLVYGAGMGGGGGMGTLQALLAEMSGLKKPRGFFNRVGRRALGMRPKPPPKYRMLLMMATNLPEALDEALLRPGRIDRIYKMGYPSKAGRIRTYEGYLGKVSHQLTPADIEKLSTMTPYATGATIKDLVNEALITAIRDGRESITWADMLRAKQLRDLGLPEDVEYVDRERHAVAVHEACHAVIAYRVRRHLTIDVATIEKGSTYLGMVASIKPEDLFTQWKSDFEADVMVALASLAGERMFFEGDSSSGVSGDLNAATLLATYMEGYWGMGETLAVHGVARQLGSGGEPTPPSTPSDDLKNGRLGSRVEDNLRGIYTRTDDLLRANRASVLAVAHALERHKTLSGDDVRAVVDGEVGPLVDGRPYHAPGATDALEEYHRRAAAAHLAHGRVGADLPSMNGHANAIDANEVTGKGRGSNGIGTNGTGNGNGSGRTRRVRRTAD
jgi:cell division protease FtsH